MFVRKVTMENSQMRSFPSVTITAAVALALLGAAVDRVSAQAHWTDGKKRLQLTLPAGWNEELQTEALVQFEGPSGSSLIIFINPATGAPAQALEAKRASLVRDNRGTTYKFGPIADVRVGVEPGKSFEFATVPRSQPNAAPQSYSTTFVSRGNTQYEFMFTSPRRGVVEAFLRSVVFLK